MCPVDTSAQHDPRQVLPVTFPPVFSGLELRERVKDARAVWRTDRGILKRCVSLRDAQQEASALRLAQRFVGTRVRVPRILQTQGDCLLLEDVGRQIDLTRRNAIQGAELLARFHAVELPDDATALLVDKGHWHYSRNKMFRRFRRQVKFARRVFGSEVRLIEKFSANVEQVLARERPDDDDVIGHGDFQPRNLCFSESAGLCAVDWHDFGLSSRWYEIAHYLAALPEAQRASAATAYRSASSVVFCDWEAAMGYGRALDLIDRAGNKARSKARDRPLLGLFKTSVDELAEHCAAENSG